MSLPSGFTLRRSTTADLDTLVEHRRAMFQDMGYTDQETMGAMAAKFRPWLLAHMNAGDYLAWVITAPHDFIAASSGLWLMDWPPHLVGKGTHRGNILNVYTYPSFRRRGLARELMQAVLSWCRGNGVDTVILHASDSGRALYESMGFAPSVPGTPGNGTNPEQLFAVGWSACYLSALKLVATGMKVRLPVDVAVNGEVDLGMTNGGYFIQVRLNVVLPGVDREVAQALVDGAHLQCPYSKATHGNINVVTTIDTHAATNVA